MKKTPVLLAFLGWLGAARAADWPVYQHDNHRSAHSPETLAASQLGEQWVYRSPQPPKPAWDGPAKWDAYAGIRGLKSMRNYDPVFHLVVVGSSLFFGSSVDDAVHCLDTRSGREKWSYTTDGAVRIAPAHWDGRLFFGSDDGHAYCLEARTGRLIWKFRPAPREPLILNDGRFIPLWPCRTGVLVDNDTAYFAMGLLPWKESYLCAVDALTGQAQGPGRYVRKLDAVTLEGALLASSQKLIAPQGRVAPLLFSRNDGKPLGGLEGGGGCFVLLTDDARVLHGPGNKTGWIQESRETDRSKIATFNGGNALVVQGNISYLLTDTGLMAMDRTSRKEIWHQACDCPNALILAGDILYAGGTDKIAAFRTSDGRRVWETAVAGRAFGLAVADGALFVSTDEGGIYCFRSSDVKPPSALATPPSAPSPNSERLHLSAGPSLEFVAGDRAIVRWRTALPSATLIEWGLPGELPRQFEERTPKTIHTATLTGLRRDRTYHYTLQSLIDGQRAATEPFECETFFNYSVPPIPDEPAPFADSKPDSISAEAAREILAESGLTQGICLVVGCGEGRLAYELAKRSQMRVIGVDTDPQKVNAARQALKPTGVYGTRIALHHVASLSELPFTDSIANLIVSERALSEGGFPAPAETLAKYLRPAGGIALMGRPAHAPVRHDPGQIKTWLASLEGMREFTGQVRGAWARIDRGSRPGAGQWSHEYGTAANTAYAGEHLQGASGINDLEVKWLGRPGPRAQADRNGRKPSPLATNGRLFVQGLHRIIALDAFNGTILWSREIPALQRFNLPRDSSNWCADRHHLYLAIDDQCWQMDAASGDLAQLHPVMPGARTDWQYDWGYVSIQGNRLIGSTVKKGTAYSEFWGGAEAGWYDAKSGPATFKVCSENLFALDERSGQRLWSRRGNAIINSTITISDGRLYFLESRHAKVRASEAHRMGLAELWDDLFLVALDLDRGTLIWEQAVHPAEGKVVVYLTHGGGKLVLVTSGEGNYFVYAFDGSDGQSLWQTQFPWPSDNHGGHMARPAIVSSKLYVRPNVFDLHTGNIMDQTVPGGGCGTYAAIDNALIFRNSNVTMWDLNKGSTTAWDRLRPDCWLSTIPADGMLLSPEAGGGCSCGSWMETSIAFAPKSAR